MHHAIITATGSYIPPNIVPNAAFLSSEFFEKDGSRLYKNNQSILDKFEHITGIKERRYANAEQTASDLAYLAAENALEQWVHSRESLDYIIVAHNAGDVAASQNRISLIPTLASKVKALLDIQNPECVAYDLPFGCPGWIEGVIQANYFIRSGDAKRCLVIGAETLSRVLDPHDRNSMIYSDGSGAVLLEASEEDDRGVLAHHTETHAAEYSHLLEMGHSFSPFYEFKSDLHLKMNGRKVYEFALQHVPLVIQRALQKANLTLNQIDKVLIHQANDKMDRAILKRTFELYGEKQPPEIMPMTIEWLGNSSVATIPTLLDLILRKKLPGHTFSKNDLALFVSVGAGMNINALVYRF